MKILNSVIILVMVPLFSAAMTLVFDLPWWFFVTVNFIGSMLFLKDNYVQSFLLNFLGTFMVWLIYFYWINHQNHSILINRLLPVLHFSSHHLLFGTVAVIGALLSGMSGTLGILAGKIMRKQLSFIQKVFD